MSNQYIVCPECANTISIYYKFFNQAKKAYYDKYIFKNKNLNDHDPNKLFFNRNNDCNLKDIFDALEINNRCCRMHIANTTSFDRITNKMFSYNKLQ
jgi:hypothetical protein